MWPDLHTFGSQVRAARHRKGLSQQDLADQIGISRTYLSQIETGRASNLSYRLARALVIHLDINPFVYVPKPEPIRDVQAVRRTLGRLMGKTLT